MLKGDLRRVPVVGVDEQQGGFLNRASNTHSVSCLIDSFKGGLKKLLDVSGNASIDSDSDANVINLLNESPT